METPTMKVAFEETQRISDNPATRRITEYRDFQLRRQLQREYDADAKRDKEIVLNMNAKQTPVAIITELTGS